MRPWRVAALASSLALTLSAAVVSVGGLLAGTPSAQAAAQTAPDEPTASPEAGGVGMGREPFLQPVVDAMAAVTLPTVGASGSSGRTLPADPPAGSGQGRRVVFDQSAQQVWLVREGGSVRSTYPVSGSVHDNLQPGHYEVYSRSAQATSFDYRSTMRWMVRFTQGDSAAIGFHAIPVDAQHRPVQSWRELGTPLSSGCIRQRPRDARALWRFAPLGTPVVVVA